LGECPGRPLFLNARGTALSHDQTLDTFQRLLASIGVGPRADGRRPHLHDLRHRFAMEVLMQWYRDGDDVQQRLPILSTFLGHSEVRHTYWYLSARPELLAVAQQRLEQYWGESS
jgi:integrase